jgi:hypothetical protein
MVLSACRDYDFPSIRRLAPQSASKLPALAPDLIKDHAIAPYNLYQPVLPLLCAAADHIASIDDPQPDHTTHQKNIPYCILYSFVNNVIKTLFCFRDYTAGNN